MKRTPLRRTTPLRRSTIRGRREPRVTRKNQASTAASVPDPEWPAARAAALIRDGYQCQRCGHAAAAVHHRVLRGMGGSRHPDRHRPDRLVSLCVSCHTWVHGGRNRAEAETLGLIVPRTGNAETTPVHTCNGTVIFTRTGAALPVQQAA